MESLETVDSERPRPCPVCGTRRGAQQDDGGCPVCLLRQAMQPESTAEDDRDEGRFDHYELARNEDGTPIELGRGAMGVTYKGFDTVLQHPAAFKVIDTRVAAYPKVRERFLREARITARLRHPNVASIFYYGVRKSDGRCFTRWNGSRVKLSKRVCAVPGRCPYPRRWKHRAGHPGPGRR